MAAEPTAPPIVTTAGGKAAEVTAVIHEDALNEQTSAPSTTTAEQDRKSAGQRGINMLWENTQARIAKSIVYANILYAFSAPFLPIVAKEMSQVLSNALFAVMGFYFGRTNHSSFGVIKEPR